MLRVLARTTRSHVRGGGSGRVMCASNQPVVLKPTSRPSLDDVDRLSRGEAAARRGTGSRAVPHRLNAEEMRQFAVSKVGRADVTKSLALVLSSAREYAGCTTHPHIRYHLVDLRL